MFTTWFKPAGIPCFPPHADPDGDCVLSRLRTADPGRFDLGWPERFHGGIAHRLDVSTSGALVVADDPESLAAIRSQFAAKTLTKTYRFLAGKSVPWDDNQCDRPIAHDKRKKQRMIVQRGPNTPHRGQWYPALTRFKRVKGSVWQATIQSGVMHQIRVHAAFVGLPLLGDRIYGGGPTPADAPEGLRYFLHHMSLRGPGIRTDEVPLPDWAR